MMDLLEQRQRLTSIAMDCPELHQLRTISSALADEASTMRRSRRAERNFRKRPSETQQRAWAQDTLLTDAVEQRSQRRLQQHSSALSQRSSCYK